MVLSQQIHAQAQRQTSSSLRSTELPLLDVLFPNHTLDYAWEHHPLHVQNILYDDPNNDGVKSCSNDEIDKNSYVSSSCSASTTASLDRATTSTKLRQTPSQISQSFHKIMSLDHLDEILSNPDLVHRKDYSLIKKVERNGQEWNGSPPTDSLTLHEMHGYFDVGGFSLVINAMQNRWIPIQHMAAQFQSEFLCHHVSCNLYMTPPGTEKEGQCGFENHFDWMDVIVLQISGSKMWTVANQPLVYLSPPDWKRKPTIDEVESYMQQPARSSTIMMRPGDVLYIPRGFVHNASTVPLLFDFDDEGEDMSEEVLQSYSEPSLHLTFGIEHRCETTVEAVLHFALRMFEEEHAVTEARAKWMSNSTSADYNIILALMHYSLSAVARFGCEEDDKEVVCRLRQSAVLHPAWNEVLGYTARSSSNDMETYYSDVLQAFSSLANLPQAIEFVALIQAGQTSPADRELHQFCIPGKSISSPLIDVINNLSDEDVGRLSSAQFDEAVSDFFNFARGRMEEAKSRWGATIGV